MDLTNKTIREIALEMPQTTKIFEELKIDYCCGGNKNLNEACESANVSAEVVAEKISALSAAEGNSESDFSDQISPSKLIDSIVEKHHVFTRDEFKRLTPLLEKVVGKHAEKHPELNDVKAIFVELSNDLIPHMQKEEMVLFPYIKNLEVSELTGQSVSPPPFGTVQNPIRMMQYEHDNAGDILKRMREQTNDYSTPEGACPSFKALYFGLEELEKDLHHHIHLENNILFPKAVTIEANGVEAAG